ncbi:MAG: 30S ribosomal protein S17e [Thermoproteota archaeon]
MGRVYTTKIKRVSKQILEQFPDTFSNDYEKNKELLKGMVDVRSKKMLNQIAGYITRIKSFKHEAEQAEEVLEER